MFGPIVPSHGPTNAKLMILAEAPGSEESERGVPLIGPSGQELRRMLRTVGVNLDDCYKANVFSRQPTANNIALYGVPRDHPSAVAEKGHLTTNPITFLHTDHLGEIERVYQEIRHVNPNLILALGNTATWALGLGQGISALRGSVHLATVPGMDRPVKVLPTFHPAMILRQWDQRVIAIADLEKAHAESHSPHLSFDNSELWINPNLGDLAEFDRRYMERATISACDIETKRGQITCLSFAPSVEHAIVVPFWIEGDNPNYWPTPADEGIAWRFVRHWMERPDLMKVFQNGLYDLQYLQAVCTPRACTEDTMLMHHSLYSELQKGLGFLGSIYANSPSWKQMRSHIRKDELLKRDD